MSLIFFMGKIASFFDLHTQRMTKRLRRYEHKSRPFVWQVTDHPSAEMVYSVKKQGEQSVNKKAKNSAVLTLRACFLGLSG